MLRSWAPSAFLPYSLSKLAYEQSRPDIVTVTSHSNNALLPHNEWYDTVVVVDNGVLENSRSQGSRENCKQTKPHIGNLYSSILESVITSFEKQQRPNPFVFTRLMLFCTMLRLDSQLLLWIELLCSNQNQLDFYLTWDIFTLLMVVSNSNFLMWSGKRNSFSLCQSKIDIFKTYYVRCSKIRLTWDKNHLPFEKQPIFRQMNYCVLIIKGHFCHAHLVKSWHLKKVILRMINHACYSYPADEESLKCKS